MKKIKIMLTTIVVMAVVGGALAFKAQKFATKYCVNTTTTPLTSYSVAYKIDQNSSAPSLYWTTRKADGTAITQSSDCTNGLNTNVSSRIAFE